MNRAAPTFPLPRRFGRSVLLAAFLASLLALGAPAGRALAEAPTAGFDAANRLYERGQYADAAAAYQRLLPTGEASPALFFNLGNAFFKAGQMGRAIAAYRQAERLAPRDPDVRANLQFARNQVQGPSAPPGRWQRGLSSLTVNEWTDLTAGVFWLAFLLLAAGQWRPEWQRRLRAYAAVSAGAGVALGACLALAVADDPARRTAIVVAREAVVRTGPLDESQSAFTVYDGAELRVLDRKEDWLQVSAGGRRLGWLKRDAVLAPDAGTPGPVNGPA